MYGEERICDELGTNKYLSNETELTDLAKLYDSRGSWGLSEYCFLDIQLGVVLTIHDDPFVVNDVSQVWWRAVVPMNLISWIVHSTSYDKLRNDVVKVQK